MEDKFEVKFKPFQREVCFKLFSGEDLFVVAPTGAGKTYCFIFLSELYKSLNPSGVAEPVTLVVSPLSGLMLDQSERCKKFGLKATVCLLDFGRVLFQWRSAEIVYRHLHHPAKNN